ncbi:tyrosine-type recombinase/integrase [Halapricum desulfuricans]|uniref:XerD/XerC family integrase n=1 Tax=Halapricum desulfuricans TaxID=2841257 RepID=A0A897NB68_9EURY|nr:site-specific integrase [Halapricum desulfuricans]QSG07636.1 XerD/XerC family integrase [Halapricum desulfuricans]
MPHSADNKVDGIVLVTEDAQEFLNPKQEITYREHRRELAEWMLSLGKNPSKAEVYSYTTAKNRMNRLDIFYRFIWDRKGRYIQDLTTDHADTWMRWLARQDYKESTKCHYQKAARTLFKWKRHARGSDTEWDPEIEYSDPSTNYQPRDYLTRQDRRRLREAAMEYGSVPHYNSVAPEERDRWKTYLAQRLQKPKDEVTKQDWNRENWIVALKNETVSILKRWIDERETREKYDDCDALWLTKYSNRYDKDSFRTVFRNVAEEAGLDLENRDLTPYSIRHSTATYIADEEGLAVAAQQCRHKSKPTTEKYERSSVDI